MNPLFQHAARAIKDAARREFRSSGLGRMVQEIEQKTAKRGRAADYLRAIGQKLHGLRSDERLQTYAERFKRSGVGREIDRYAKGGVNDPVFDQIFGALGPLGDVLKAILRPKGKSVASSIQRELRAASEMLKAFGWETVPPPSRRGGRSKADAAKEYLESLGFKVTAPQEQRAPEPNKPRERKTVDIDIGLGRTKRFNKNDPLVTGEMIPVSSSNVHSIGFNIDWQAPQIGTLKVRFLQASRDGKSSIGGPLYEYYNIPTTLFEKFRKASSKGKFVWDSLRVRGTVSGHKFDYRLMGVTNGYVPRKATLIGDEEWFVKRQFKGERNGEFRVFTSGADMRARYVPNRGAPNRGRPRR